MFTYPVKRIVLYVLPVVVIVQTKDRQKYKERTVFIVLIMSETQYWDEDNEQVVDLDKAYDPFLHTALDYTPKTTSVAMKGTQSLIQSIVSSLRTMRMGSVNNRTAPTSLCMASPGTTTDRFVDRSAPSGNNEQEMDEEAGDEAGEEAVLSQHDVLQAQLPHAVEPNENNDDGDEWEQTFSFGAPATNNSLAQSIPLFSGNDTDEETNLDYDDDEYESSPKEEYSPRRDTEEDAINISPSRRHERFIIQERIQTIPIKYKHIFFYKPENHPRIKFTSQHPFYKQYTIAGIKGGSFIICGYHTLSGVAHAVYVYRTIGVLSKITGVWECEEQWDVTPSTCQQRTTKPNGLPYISKPGEALRTSVCIRTTRLYKDKKGELCLRFFIDKVYGKIDELLPITDVTLANYEAYQKLTGVESTCNFLPGMLCIDINISHNEKNNGCIAATFLPTYENAVLDPVYANDIIGIMPLYPNEESERNKTKWTNKASPLCNWKYISKDDIDPILPDNDVVSTTLGLCAHPILYTRFQKGLTDTYDTIDHMYVGVNTVTYPPNKVVSKSSKSRILLLDTYLPIPPREELHKILTTLSKHDVLFEDTSYLKLSRQNDSDPPPIQEFKERVHVKRSELSLTEWMNAVYKDNRKALQAPIIKKFNEDAQLEEVGVSLTDLFTKATLRDRVEEPEIDNLLRVQTTIRREKKQSELDAIIQQLETDGWDEQQQRKEPTTESTKDDGDDRSSIRRSPSPIPPYPELIPPSLHSDGRRVRNRPLQEF